MNEQSLAGWRERAVKRMERSRRATLLFLARLPKQEIKKPRTQGQWSVKDVLAHCVAWEDEGARRLQLIARGQGQRIHYYDDMREADRFNANAVRKARARGFPALVREAARVRQRLIKSLRGLPPRALQDPTHRFPVVAWLPEFAWTHEQAHLKEMRAWWSAQKPVWKPGISVKRS